MLKNKSKFDKGDWWSCTRFPKCTCVVRNVGFNQRVTVGDKETRHLRRKAHQIAEDIWGSWECGDKKSMYNWLDKNSKSGHIGEMDKDELIRIINKMIIYNIKKMRQNEQNNLSSGFRM